MDYKSESFHIVASTLPRTELQAHKNDIYACRDGVWRRRLDVLSLYLLFL